MIASQIIQNAYRRAGILLAAGRTESTSQSNEGLYVLNSLLETLRLQSMTWYEVVTSVTALTPGLNPHTVGIGGDIPIERPVKILQAYLRYTASTPYTDTIIRELTYEQYAQIPAKDIQSQIPLYYWYNPRFDSVTDPKGQLYLYMVPSQAYPIVLYCPVILTQPASLSTTLLLPPGYQRMLEYNLAKEFIPLFRKRLNTPAADALVMNQATESLYWCKVNNAIPMDVQSDWPALGNQGIFDWRTGYFRW